MRICIPTRDDGGAAAVIHDHFGSAPFFTLVDTDGGDVTVLPNSNAHHAHGTCHPLAQLAGKDIQAIVVRGIGRRALESLHASGLKAYRPDGATVADTLPALLKGELAEIDVVHACGGHGHGSRHGHGHGHGHDHDHDGSCGHGRRSRRGAGRGRGL